MRHEPQASSRSAPVFDPPDFLADLARDIPLLQREQARPLPTPWSAGGSLVVFNLMGALLWALQPWAALALLAGCVGAGERWYQGLGASARRVQAPCLTSIGPEACEVAAAVWRMRSRRLFRWFLRSSQVGTGLMLCSVLAQASAFNEQSAQRILAQLAVLGCLSLSLVRGHQCLHQQPVRQVLTLLSAKGTRPW